MAFSDQIYVAYDGNNDSVYFKQMLKWQRSNGDAFPLIDGYEVFKLIDKESDESVKAKLHDCMSRAQVFVILITATTKSYRRLIRWQIEYAIAHSMPMIAMNVNGIRSVDYDRAPTVLKKNLSMHITFNPMLLEYALDRWPQSHVLHQQKEHAYTMRYSEQVYDQLLPKTEE